MAITVHEVTMAAPDIVCVEVRTPSVTKGTIETTVATASSATGTRVITNCADNGAGLIRVTVSTSTFNSGNTGSCYVIADVVGCTEANGAWIITYVDATNIDLQQSTFTNAYSSGGRLILGGRWISGTDPVSGQASQYLDVGPTGKHRKWQDTMVSEFLDEAAAIVHGDYGAFGALTITKASLKKEPFDEGQCSAATYTKTVAFRYYLYLKLSANISNGSYTIDFPTATGISDYAFTFNDGTTRCSSIRVNQVGYRPSDAEKSATLSHWAPGQATNGAIEFATAYSISAFTIINDTGVQVYSGSVSLRIDPNDAETGGAITIPRLASSTTTPLTITGITNANPGVVTYTGTDPTNGDFIYFNHVGGMSINAVYGKVANVNAGANTFEINTEAGANYNTTSLGTYTSGGRVYFTDVVNHAGTYVYGLDFSAFEPTADTRYRIKIAGLGVSDEFYIDDAVWFLAATAYGSGEYAQRNGIAPDGRFGYTTPMSIKAGDDKTIYKSYLMGCFSSEGPGVGTTIAASTGANSTWRKADSPLSGAWGGWKDAGDWDSFATNDHMLCAWNMLDTWLMLPSGPRTASWGLPSSSSVRDPTTFAGTDNVGDLFHAAMWQVDFYRQLQNPDGSVPGGIQFTGTVFGEPSWLNKWPWYVYEPDHLGTFSACAAFAKASQVCTAAGLTTLATTFQNAAQDAWDWAENIYTDATDRDAHFLDLKTKAGWSAGTYTTQMAALLIHVDQARAWAAASMMRMNDTPGIYEAIVMAAYNGGWSGYGTQMSAMWEFINTTGVNATDKTTLTNAITTRASTGLIDTYEGTSGYKPLRFHNLDWEFGSGGTTWSTVAMNVIYAHQISGDAKYIKAIQAGFGYILGCNQTGKSYTTGLGTRWPTRLLHIDAQASGATLSPGLSVYGPCTVTGISQALNFAPGQLNWLAEGDNSANTATHKDHHELVPPRGGWPTYEVMWEIPGLIEIMEYTMPQTTGMYLSVAMYLHGYDGNTQTEVYGGSVTGCFGLQF